ncbi:hypothetical protein EGR_10810 [Echinococcus granulosus]|uniref:Uncharacterized protein n=1 Tax=Echinococcus granulosus TaxID=6210 RepID=W6TZS7_ECHGR|nr:hypothetical protein EGR_10810 [Echinococcus granulosus]EUB54335.1 hypothetical protein EGR_10810 [Echinococcus granulosus]
MGRKLATIVVILCFKVNWSPNKGICRPIGGKNQLLNYFSFALVKRWPARAKTTNNLPGRNDHIKAIKSPSILSRNILLLKLPAVSVLSLHQRVYQSNSNCDFKSPISVAFTAAEILQCL